MEDLTEDQVLEIARKQFPNLSDEQIMQAFQSMQQQAGTNNYETILLIQEMMKQDMNAAGQSPEQAPEAGRFGGLLGKLRN